MKKIIGFILISPFLIFMISGVFAYFFIALSVAPVETTIGLTLIGLTAAGITLLVD